MERERERERDEDVNHTSGNIADTGKNREAVQAHLGRYWWLVDCAALAHDVALLLKNLALGAHHLARVAAGAGAVGSRRGEGGIVGALALVTVQHAVAEHRQLLVPRAAVADHQEAALLLASATRSMGLDRRRCCRRTKQVGS